MANVPISKIQVPGSEDTLLLRDSTAANKVQSATNDNLAALDENGNLKDAGWSSLKTTTAVSGNPISITGLKSNQPAVNPIVTFSSAVSSVTLKAANGLNPSAQGYTVSTDISESLGESASGTWNVRTGVFTKSDTTTIQLTPHEVILAEGDNYVSSNGTSISVSYHNGELASLADVSQLGETVNLIGDSVSVLNNDVLGLQNAIIDRWYMELPSGTLSTSITIRNQWGGVFLVVSKRPTATTTAVYAVYICAWHAGGSSTSTRIFGTEDITITGGGNTMSITYSTNQYGLTLDVYQLLY